jgi:hypothetical protein
VNFPAWAYALLCVALPVAWGLAMVWASNWLERRFRARHRHSHHDPSPPPPTTLEYHI